MIMAFLIMYVFKILYFQSHTEYELHALTTRETPGALTWIFLHWPLSYFLIWIGVSFKILVNAVDTYQRHTKQVPTYNFLPAAIAMPGTIVLMWMVRTSHKTFL